MLLAICKKMGTNYVEIEKYTAHVSSGNKDITYDVVANVGPLFIRHYFKLIWSANLLDFSVEERYSDLIGVFMQEFRDFKLNRLSKHDLFFLLQKANRRRKSEERKVKKLREKLHRVNHDALIAINNRQRIIEEQWEVMRELQRRGMVSTEDIEKVINDIIGQQYRGNIKTK